MRWCRSSAIGRAWLGLVVALATLASSQSFAQSAPSSFTTAIRYDAMRRVVGTIAPDPDGTGPILYAAVRNTYDAAGRLTKVETGQLSAWQSEAVAPSAWGAAFTVYRKVDSSYDAMSRKTRDTVSGLEGGSLVVKTVTDYSYDNVGRPLCTTVRMNPSTWGTVTSACTPQTASTTNGPDRISKNVYDAAGQLLQTRDGVGTSLDIATATYDYTPNGKKSVVIDANGNRATLAYDEFDRLQKWTFPSTTRPNAYNDSSQATALSTAGAVNASDYEQYGYDAGSNRTSFRKRDGSTLTYSYDALDRVSVKTVPSRAGLTAAQTRDVYYAYNARGSMTEARFDSLTGPGVSNVYDDLNQLTSTTDTTAGAARTLSFLYDADGNRTRITHSDGNAFTYAFDGLDRLTNIYQGTGTTTKLETFTYGADSTLASRSEGTGASATYTWDGIGRLIAQADTIGGTGNNVSWSIVRNPASQVTSETRTDTSNAYAFPAIAGTSRPYVANGLNQYASVATNNYAYDGNGNLTSDGTGGNAYTYDVENRLVKAVAGATTTNLLYDPLGRLVETDQGTAATTQRLLYDGEALATLYDSADTLNARYIHGSNVEADDPLVWYSGAGLTTKFYLHADRLGSIVAITNGNGASYAKNAYDEYGVPAAGNSGRFQYTGQMWLPQLGMYYYKGRFYSPQLGRFPQTDPIGYDGGINLYEYVNGDPINAVDYMGTETASITCMNNACGQSTGFIDLAVVSDFLDAIGDVANSIPDGALVGGPLKVVAGAMQGVRETKVLGQVVKADTKAAATAKEVGSYLHTFESGRTYDGKGTRSRAAETARNISEKNNDSHVSTHFTPATNSREAFKQESRGLEQRGGPKSDRNYNRIDSPGTKMRREDR